MKCITALDIIEGKNCKAKSGFVKVNVDLNKGAGGNYIYLCTKTEESNTAVVDIKVLLGKDAKAPNGYKKIDVDLNHGADGDYIYLSYKIGNAEESRKFGFTEMNVYTSDDEIKSAPDGYGMDITDLNKGAGGKFLYFIYKNNSTVTMSNWMKEITDNTFVKDISIPGTHDTMAYRFKGASKVIETFGKTQHHNLDAQLRAGCRFFDVRFNDNLDCCHNAMVCYYSLDFALDTLKNFLDRNPSETLIVRLSKRTGKDENNQAKEVIKKYASYMVRCTEDKDVSKVKMGEVRGKMLILQEGINDSYFQYPCYEYKSAYIDRQDDYKEPSIATKYGEVVSMIENENCEKLRINHVSAVAQDISIAKWTPREYADNLNPKVTDYLQEHSSRRKTGVIVFDFVDTNICREVVNHNFLN